ncbi:MAG: helix-turn-helix transcriptional regulator [Lachnospira sp.]|nr:helix-turn-helix transcriptional regulator [Lachnospira sp.]
MEFKDKLKQLRKERNVSQQALAEAVYVSRSAVAKWENGYGLPSEESYEALCKYFEVSEDYFKTEEPEEIIVEKNKILGRIKYIAETVALILLTVISFAIPILIIRGNWGITSQMAAGEIWKDNICIKSDDYHIYLEAEVFDLGYGAMIDGFVPVKKNFYGWTVNEKAYSYREVYIKDSNGDTDLGLLYSFKGKDGYHNIFIPIIVIKEGGYKYPECICKPIIKITIGDKDYNVQYNGYFLTEERVDSFELNGTFVFVHPGIVPYNDNYDYFMN